MTTSQHDDSGSSDAIEDANKEQLNRSLMDLHASFPSQGTRSSILPDTPPSHESYHVDSEEHEYYSGKQTETFSSFRGFPGSPIGFIRGGPTANPPFTNLYTGGWDVVGSSLPPTVNCNPLPANVPPLKTETTPTEALAKDQKKRQSGFTICTKCRAKFPRKKKKWYIKVKNFKAHTEFFHSSKPEFTCGIVFVRSSGDADEGEICGKTFPDNKEGKKRWKGHLEFGGHWGDFQCPNSDCQIDLSSLKRLRKHMKTTECGNSWKFDEETRQWEKKESEPPNMEAIQSMDPSQKDQLLQELLKKENSKRVFQAPPADQSME